MTQRHATLRLYKVIILITLGAQFSALAALNPGVHHRTRLDLPAVRRDDKIESGRFRIYNIQRPLGTESYEITPDGESRIIKVTTDYSYLGTRVKLEASLRTRADLTPEKYEIKGMTSTQSRIDTAIDINADQANVREGADSRSMAVPKQFFTVTSYAPMSIQMMLFRYCAAHKIKDRISTLPRGEVTLEHRGQDTVTVNGHPVPLERYSVGGVVWGKESIWLDPQNNLVAMAGGDAELDRMEAIREGYESFLSTFVAKSVADGLADLQKLADRTKPLQAGKFAIVGGLLIDGSGKEPISDSVVIVDGNRISAVGSRAQVAIPKGMPIVDAHGKSVLPGLWDMHGHFEQVEWPAVTLAAGVTTVRDMGNEFELVTGLRAAIKSGHAIGPRMLLAGIVDNDVPNGLGVITATTPDEARAVVNRYKQAGFDQIKIYQSFRPDLLPVITAEAHRQGMTVTGHVPTGMNVFQFIESGADQVNHLSQVVAAMRPKNTPRGTAVDINLDSDEAKTAIQFFKDHRVVLDPTLSRSEQSNHSNQTPYIDLEPGVAKMPYELTGPLNSTGRSPEVAPRAAFAFAQALKVYGALFHAGIPIVLGSDLVVPGYSIFREMELSARAGLTPMEVIQAATIVPARVMNLDKESGTLEVGKRADIIIVDGNPLESISNIRKLKFVVANGRMYDPAPLWQSAGFR